MSKYFLGFSIRQEGFYCDSQLQIAGIDSILIPHSWFLLLWCLFSLHPACLKAGTPLNLFPQCRTHQRLLCTTDFTKYSEFTEGNYSTEKEMIFQALQMSSVTVSKGCQTILATGNLLLAVDLSLKPDPLPRCPRSLLFFLRDFKNVRDTCPSFRQLEVTPKFHLFSHAKHNFSYAKHHPLLHQLNAQLTCYN